MKKIMSCLAQNHGEGWCSGTIIMGSDMFHLETGVQTINTLRCKMRPTENHLNTVVTIKYLFFM